MALINRTFAQKFENRMPPRAAVFTWMWKSLWILLVHFLLISPAQTQVESTLQAAETADQEELKIWTQPVLKLVISPRSNFVELDPEFFVYLDVYQQMQALEKESTPARPSRGIASETIFIDEGANYGTVRVDANSAYQNLESSNWNNGLGDSMASGSPWHNCDGEQANGCMYLDPGVEYSDPAAYCNGDPICMRAVDREFQRRRRAAESAMQDGPNKVIGDKAFPDHQQPAFDGYGREPAPRGEPIRRGSGGGSVGGGGSTTAYRPELNSCQAAYNQAQGICGTAHQQPNENMVMNYLNGQTMMNFAQFKAQLDMMKASAASRDMLQACTAARDITRNMALLNGAYAAGCEAARSHCISTCGQYMDDFRNWRVNGDVDETDNTSFGHRELAGNYKTSCETEMAQTAQLGLMSTMQVAQSLSQSQACVDQLSAMDKCDRPDAYLHEECRDICNREEYKDLPACRARANMDCSDPEKARLNPYCICVVNPNDPSCTSGGTTWSGNNPSGPRIGSGPGGDGQMPGTDAGGTFGRGGSADFSSTGAAEFQGFNTGSLSGAAGGAQMGSGGGGGGFGRGSGGSGGGAGAGSPQAAGADNGFNTGIMNGFYGANQQRRRGAASGAQSGAGRAAAYYGARPIGAASGELDLKQYLPRGDLFQQQVVAGMVNLNALDGVTGPNGPSLFKKVSRQYRRQETKLLP